MPSSSDELAVQRVGQALPHVDAAARAAASTPCPASRAGRAGSARASRAAPRRGSAARPSTRADEPKPRSPRSDVGQLVDDAQLDRRHGQQHELRDPHPGLDLERVLAVGVQEDDAQLAAVAGVDEPGRVHDRDPVLDRRGRSAAARSRRSRAGSRRRRPSRRVARSPGLEHDALARGEVEARVSRRRRAAAARRPAAAGGSAARRAQPSSRFRSASAITNGAKRTRSRRGSRARMKTPSGSSLPLLDRRAERVQLREPRALVVRARAAAPPRSAPRSARAIRARSSSRPFAGQRRDLERVAVSGSRAAAARADRAGRPC